MEGPDPRAKAASPQVCQRHGAAAATAVPTAKEEERPFHEGGPCAQGKESAASPERLAGEAGSVAQTSTGQNWTPRRKSGQVLPRTQPCEWSQLRLHATQSRSHPRGGGRRDGKRKNFLPRSAVSARAPTPAAGGPRHLHRLLAPGLGQNTRASCFNFLTCEK